MRRNNGDAAPGFVNRTDLLHTRAQKARDHSRVVHQRPQSDNAGRTSLDSLLAGFARNADRALYPCAESRMLGEADSNPSDRHFLRAFSQSAMNLATPASVRGCFAICMRTA